MNKAVFLDRDGTLIVDKDYLDNPDGIELLPGAGEALKELAAMGFKLVLVTNQSGIARGYFDETAVVHQHHRLEELLKPFDVAFDDIQFCPHGPDDGCKCRKPETGMLEDAAGQLDIDFENSWMIGDKVSDIEAGQALGCQTIMISESVDISKAVTIIKKHSTPA